MAKMANDSKEKLNTFKHDANDVVDEVKNRAQAALHNAKADIDAAKREARHDAAHEDDGPT
jgi:ElaB/YqjD/DUF883 family membrane-anchored ribosome-binding protein